MRNQDLQHTGESLLNALWRSPDRIHQIGTMDRQTKRFRNIRVSGVSDAVRRSLDLSGAGTDAYFACAEYRTPGNRAAANVSGAFAFSLDIDCGEEKAAGGKGYATVLAAEIALHQFCVDARLPEPTHIVHSGGGLHVYWALADVVDRETWQAYAAKFKRLTRAHGFLADDSRTADIASVLRMPGTLNYKYDPPRPVLLRHASVEFIARSAMLDALASAHDKLRSSAAIAPSGHPGTAPTPDITGNGSKFSFGPPNLSKLASALAVLDPDCNEETWKLRRLAPMADAARRHPELAEALYEMAWSWSSGELCGNESQAWITPGGNGLTGEEVFDSVWERFLQCTYGGTPVSLGTIFYDAVQAGWVDPGEQFVIESDEDGGRE